VIAAGVGYRWVVGMERSYSVGDIKGKVGYSNNEMRMYRGLVKCEGRGEGAEGFEIRSLVARVLLS
jgi:hypothetical protein